MRVALLLLLATWLDASSAQNIALMALLASQSALGTSGDWWSCYKQGPPQTCSHTCVTCSGSYKGINVTCSAPGRYERCTGWLPHNHGTNSFMAGITCAGC